MSLSKTEFSGFIRQFRFRELFNEMGWNNDQTREPVIVEGITYSLQAVAEKSGFRILECLPNPDGLIPDYNTRKKIENRLTRLFQEHLIIFVDQNKTEQIWQSVVRQTGKPTKITETRWTSNQEPQLLYQRTSGLFFTLDEEEKITIVDVTRRVGENFHQNAEKVTKKFYERFKTEHTSFIGFIKGIEKRVDAEWYASLMLNRLMFCYFIQKKGFLDNNPNYLRDKLNACKARRGKDKFYSFYRNFLLVLFHEGLNELEQSPEVKAEIGRIPYLNGGLFDEHELEKSYKDIDIRDDAFERVFDFFEQYEWHLDVRAEATGNEVNPDVIGYIFEKYINDRSQMGAYYTKEDITDYISKNCIIPYLFDETKRRYPKPFGAKGDIWKLAAESGDRYIYDAVKHGINPDTACSNINDGDDCCWSDLPEEVRAGINPEQTDLVELRKAWNKTAPAEIALPTEIYREVIDRRKRYHEVKSRIETGEIQSINDFITYNLNIRQFAQDVTENTDDPDLVRSLYKTLSAMTILDPTCGSGAFLFAALNILEPLYEACLNRMRAFVEDEDRRNKADNKNFSHKYKDLRDNLAQTQNEHHPNLQYFIFKSIILQNLYGVDIMKEAVEIAKLRLFLKLVASVEPDYRKPNLGLEPLPDIDFNIRAGNSLVGFATEAELNKGLTWTLDGQMAKPVIEEKCEIVAGAFKRYKAIQLGSGENYGDFKTAKEELNRRLKELNHELNLLLHKQASGLEYDKWLQSHQPFHWFAEFYEIIQDRKGFDVIIGNPPYVECSKIDYKIDDFSTIKAGNLYALVIENSSKFLNRSGYLGMIVQNSIVCTKRMLPIQNLLIKNYNTYFSNYDDRPAKLFTGIHHMKGTIFLATPPTQAKEHQTHTTKFYRWYEEFREYIFDTLSYEGITKSLLFQGHISKYSDSIHAAILRKIYTQKQLGLSLSNTGYEVYCHRIASYFIKSIDFIPYFYNEKSGQKKSDDYKTYFTDNELNKSILMALFNSNVFYLNWHSLHDGYHCGKKNIDEYPFNFPGADTSLSKKLSSLGFTVSSDYKSNSSRKETFYKNSGVVIYDEFYPKLSKPIIDEIDTVLAEHYGFTAEELDFIINYDIKYRIGKELGGEG